jgi:hypothetical protein
MDYITLGPRSRKRYWTLGLVGHDAATIQAGFMSALKPVAERRVGRRAIRRTTVGEGRVDKNVTIPVRRGIGLPDPLTIERVQAFFAGTASPVQNSADAFARLRHCLQRHDRMPHKLGASAEARLPGERISEGGVRGTQAIAER